MIAQAMPTRSARTTALVPAIAVRIGVMSETPQPGQPSARKLKTEAMPLDSSPLKAADLPRCL